MTDPTDIKKDQLRQTTGPAGVSNVQCDSTFFAVSRAVFAKAVSLGINPASALLVLASGTGRSGTVTKWGAEAVAGRLCVRWTTARGAIDQLVKAGLVTCQRGTTARAHPTYTLASGTDLVWLPQTLITGAGAETPPLVWIRQTQDPMLLRLLVDLYAVQNLREHGGVDPSIVWVEYTRKQVGQRGARTVWEFTSDGATTIRWGNDVTDPHRMTLTKAQVSAGVTQGTDFFERMRALLVKGLIELVPYLFEGTAGEPLHPMNLSGFDHEASLYRAARAAAVSMLTPGQLAHINGFIVPVASHIKDVRMIGVARLVYRPHTQLTRAWWASNLETCQRFAAQYSAMVEPDSTTLRKVGAHDF